MWPVQGATTKAYSLEYVEEEQRRNGPRLGFPEGLDDFGLRLRRSIGRVPLRVRIPPGSLSGSKIASANPLRTPRRVYETMKPPEALTQTPSPTSPAIPTDPTFVDFLCFSLDPAFRRLEPSQRQAGIREFLSRLQARRADVSLRTYLSIGLRHDTDFFLWTIAKDLSPFQTLTADLLKTGLGRYLKLSYTFVAMTRPSVYNPMHIPAFEEGEPPKRYLFLYPFVKSREWYLLPFERRREIMRGHMAVGETYPMVRLNTTYSFGLGDQDFVLAFETDQPAAFEDLVQRLRESQASRYTVRDTPFILGTFCKTPDILIEGLGLHA